MSVNLIFIINAGGKGKNRPEDWKRLLIKLLELNIEPLDEYDADGNRIKPTGDWKLDTFVDYDGVFMVEFDGAFRYSITMYENIVTILCIHRYWILYDNYQTDGFVRFRKELYQITRVFGGSEGIYLPDNLCKLSIYYELATQNTPYETIKTKMIKQYGKPVTDFSRLKTSDTECEKPTEFFLEKFEDLKRGKS